MNPKASKMTIVDVITVVFHVIEFFLSSVKLISVVFLCLKSDLSTWTILLVGTWLWAGKLALLLSRIVPARVLAESTSPSPFLCSPSPHSCS